MYQSISGDKSWPEMSAAASGLREMENPAEEIKDVPKHE